MKDLSFTDAAMLTKGEFDTPFIASLPHSGTYIPENLEGLYTDAHLGRLRNTDWHLPEIYAFLPSIGVTTITANFSRYVVDVNRGLEQLKSGKNYKSALITTTDTWGEPILKNPEQDLKEVFRIANFYMPFHDALSNEIRRKIAKFGKVYLLDMHSFDTQPLSPDDIFKYGVDTAADIYLGAGDFSEFGPYLKAGLTNALFRSRFNVNETPRFPGGHIVRHYGSNPNVEACMVELKYMTYMADSSANGDHMPEIDHDRADPTIAKLKKALTDMVNAYSLETRSRYDLAL